MRRVHREATERMGANRLGWNRRWKRGLAYRRTEETDLLRSKRGSCSSGGVWRTAKRDSMGYCSSPPSTPSSLHELLFIHRRPPPASTCDYSSTGSCSSCLHRVLLHLLLFNQPSTGSCSSSPPRGPVHPPPTGSIGVLFIQRQHHGVMFIQTPQKHSLFIKGRRQQGSIGFK